MSPIHYGTPESENQAKPSYSVAWTFSVLVNNKGNWNVIYQGKTFPGENYPANDRNYSSSGPTRTVKGINGGFSNGVTLCALAQRRILSMGRSLLLFVQTIPTCPW
jgi:hypothetical protein